MSTVGGEGDLGEEPAQPVGGAGECGGGCPVVVVVKRVEFA